MKFSLDTFKCQLLSLDSWILSSPEVSPTAKDNAAAEKIVAEAVIIDALDDAIDNTDVVTVVGDTDW